MPKRNQVFSKIVKHLSHIGETIPDVWEVGNNKVYDHHFQVYSFTRHRLSHIFQEMSSNGDASISSVSVDEPAGLVLPRRQGRRGSRGRSRGRPQSGSSTSRSASRGRRRGSRGRGIGRGDRARHRADEAEEAVVEMEQNLEVNTRAVDKEILR